jgi:hypothetical protein
MKIILEIYYLEKIEHHRPPLFSIDAMHAFENKFVWSDYLPFSLQSHSPMPRRHLKLK